MTLTIAVTGLHRGENPQPGAAVVASLRRKFRQLRIVGLVYDAWESGIYADDIADAVYQMPLPSAGRAALEERWEYILSREKVKFAIPCLDAELHGYLKLQQNLASRDVGMLLPSPTAFQACRKSELAALQDLAGVKIPTSFSVVDVAGLRRAALEIGYPVFVKGPFYGAYRVFSEAALVDRFHELINAWGGPVIVQQVVVGGEFDVTGLADGQGNVEGLCTIRKTVVSDRGKGFGGITVDDDELRQISLAILGKLEWRGPFELEFIRTESGDYYLIEVNPRFPAWIDFPSAFGHNLPGLLIDTLTQDRMPSLPPCPAGKFFVRHCVDLLADVTQLGQLSTSGELHLSSKDRAYA